jgi:hypothetical protein
MKKLQYKHKKTGDIVTWDGGVYRLPNNVYVIPVTFIEDCDDWEEIKEVILPEPQKKFLFVSEDSIDIYEGDDIWSVLGIGNDYQIKRERNVKSNKQFSGLGHIYFKSVNNANDWVEKNKPIYSISDITKALERIYDQFSNIYPIEFLRILKKQIKEIKK